MESKGHRIGSALPSHMEVTNMQLPLKPFKVAQVLLGDLNRVFKTPPPCPANPQKQDVTTSEDPGKTTTHTASTEDEITSRWGVISDGSDSDDTDRANGSSDALFADRLGSHSGEGAKSANSHEDGDTAVCKGDADRMGLHSRADAEAAADSAKSPFHASVAGERVEEQAPQPLPPTTPPQTPPPAIQQQGGSAEALDIQPQGQHDPDKQEAQSATPSTGSDPSRDCPESQQLNEAKIAEVQAQIAARTTELLASNPNFKHKTIMQLNNDAAAFQRAGDNIAAVAAYALLFRKVREGNMIHRELYVTHCNRAAAYIKLGLFQEALLDGERCRVLADAAYMQGGKSGKMYIKSFLRKGQALMGLGRHREASLAYEEGLRLDPFNWDLKEGLEEAGKRVLRDLLEGKGTEVRRLAAPEPVQRVTNHPYSAPLHRVKTDNMLPLQLITPFQAESEHHIKDTYNYVTIMTDIRMPKRHFRFLQDTYRHAAFAAAIKSALRSIEAEDKDARVLHLGAGAGLYTMIALREGAHHVTAVERWLYLAMACKEALAANGFSDDRATVVYKRPTDLALLKDVDVCCNLLICDIFDEGLLTSGVIPAMRHALHNLLTVDAIVIPASATVYAQAVEVKTPDVCGLDMGNIDRHRWLPAYAAGTPLGRDMCRPLSEAVEVWHFDLLAPPEASDARQLDLTFTAAGAFNAVRFWFDLHLTPDIRISTGPEGLAAGLKSLGPALQYLAGEMAVQEGQVLPLLATHNTVRMRFDMERAEYTNLMKSDASFPHHHFCMLADAKRNQAYDAAIGRAVKRRRDEDGEVHVLDMGAGSGVLAMMAARAGADSVVACDMHEPLAAVARHAVARNGCSDKVSVVQRDIGLLERGKEVRRLGVNLAVADFFDSGLLGDQFLYLLELAKKRVLQPGATFVPNAATLYCMGIQVITPQPAGFSFATLDKFRWNKDYEACYLDDIPHRRLTQPRKVFEYFFEGDRRGRGRDNIVKLDVVEQGTVNAVVFWFDLHLDDVESITSGPRGIGSDGRVLGDLNAHSLHPQPPLATGSPAAPEELQPQAAVAPQQRQPAPTDFVASRYFRGARPGFVFQLGDLGVGYYRDLAAAEGAAAIAQGPHAAQDPAAKVGQEPAARPVPGEAHSAEYHAYSEMPSPGKVEANQPTDPLTGLVGTGCAADLAAGDAAFQLRSHPSAASSTRRLAAAPGSLVLPPAAAAPAELEKQLASQAAGTVPPTSPQQKSKAGGSTEGPPAMQPSKAKLMAVQAGNEVKAHREEEEEPRHYWGQALQFLERAVEVTPARKLTLLAKRDANHIRFSLREGVGSWVGKPPWLVEWGGGASVENPHVQRVHYCQLLVSDFLMRVKSRRFPSIEKDMKMVLAHCGSLFLDPAALTDIYHEMVVLEKIHAYPEFCPGASLEAITRPPLRRH